MKQFDYDKYLTNNPLLKEAIFNTDPDMIEVERALLSDPTTSSYENLHNLDENELRELVLNAYRLGLKKKF
jgi:hypothetical protein